MRPDGDPEHDDHGLPRVDVVIPDDARELERDLIAYRREERRKRRRERTRRLLEPLGRFGIVVPLTAGALAIALISGTLLIALGPRPVPRMPADPVAARPSAAPGQIGGPLPNGKVTVVTGATPHEVDVPDLRAGVIGIVPPGCDCGALVADLARIARANRIGFWLVADRRRATVPERESLKGLRALAGESHEGVPGLLSDPRHVLASAYDPDPSDGRLTAVLVHTDGVVAEVLHGPVPGPMLAQRISALKTAGARTPR